MKVKNKTTGNWDQITLGSVTIDNSLGSDSTTHGASVHAVNAGLAGKISGDGSVEKIVRSETAPTGTEATIWIEPSDFNSAETTILKDTLEDKDLDKAPTVRAVKQAIDNVKNVDYDSLPVRSKIEYTKENSWDQAPAGYTESTVPYTLEGVGEKIDRLENFFNYPKVEEERIIGYWIDGKPIYRKTYLIGHYTYGTNVDDIQLETDNTINLVKSYGYLILSGFQVGIGTGDIGFGAISNVNRNANGLLYISRTHGAYGSYESCRITIEYTKTTDSAIGISEVSS